MNDMRYKLADELTDIANGIDWSKEIPKIMVSAFFAHINTIIFLEELENRNLIKIKNSDGILQFLEEQKLILLKN